MLARLAVALQPQVIIRGGGANVRQALYMSGLVVARLNAGLKTKYQQLVAVGNPAKVALPAVMRKLVVTANALLKAGRLSALAIPWPSRIL